MFALVAAWLDTSTETRKNPYSVLDPAPSQRPCNPHASEGRCARIPLRGIGTRPSRSQRPNAVSHTHDTASSIEGLRGIVGIGASAGGLAAFQAFFDGTLAKAGVAYVVITHLASGDSDLLPELLGRHTDLPVTCATHDEPVLPDHVYVIPPNQVLRITAGRLQLEPGDTDSRRHALDRFLSPLAVEQGNRAIAVILSGTGADGTAGAKAVHAHEGLVLVQQPDSASFPEMPQHVEEAGYSDLTLPPGSMPDRIMAYLDQLDAGALPGADTPSARPCRAQRHWLDAVFELLRRQVGHDFSHYKTNTLLRRIARRMALNHIQDRADYLQYLHTQPAEGEALFRELLIGVTHFFRDADAFASLKQHIIDHCLTPAQNGDVLRAWVPGCSTGEEAYSLAMILWESLDKHPQPIKLQIFATDVDRRAIQQARSGVFPHTIEAEVSATRLARFFYDNGQSYGVRPELRNVIVFSEHDLLQHPPFSRLDVLLCRNLLIYLKAKTQQRLLPLFHYTLNPNGLLMLGTSESIGGFSNLFEPLDERGKIYQRRAISDGAHTAQYLPSNCSTPSVLRADQPEGGVFEVKEAVQRVLLERFTPTALLVDGTGSLIYVHGRTGRYLENTTGLPRQNLLEMAREGLRPELTTAFREARTRCEIVTRERVKVKTDGGWQLIHLHILPRRAPTVLAGRYIVVFEAIEDAPAREPLAPSESPVDRTPEERIAQLERQLAITRDDHQTAIEELEASNEELKATNEELHSANEELQSSNEELESSQEELQSLNEELQTVNAELQEKVDALATARDDIHNLLDATHLSAVLVDERKTIRWFTPTATQLINLIASDIGRPLSDVSTRLTDAQPIHDQLDRVLTEWVSCEHQIQDRTGTWYAVRITPYRTRDQRIGGAVLTFNPIQTHQSFEARSDQSRQDAALAWELVRSILDSHPQPIALAEPEGRLVLANLAFSDILGVTQAHLADYTLAGLPGRWSGAPIMGGRPGAAVGPTPMAPGTQFEPSPGANTPVFRVDARPLRNRPDRGLRILLRFMPITPHTSNEEGVDDDAPGAPNGS